MTVHWTTGAAAAACGIAGVALVVVVRALRKMKPLLTPLNAMSSFLAFTLAPSVVVLIEYPFIEPKPDLGDHAVFLVLAAFALLWAIYEAFRQGLK